MLETIKQEWREFESYEKVLAVVTVLLASMTAFVVVASTHGLIFFPILLIWGVVKFMNWFAKEDPNAKN